MDDVKQLFTQIKELFEKQNQDFICMEKKITNNIIEHLDQKFLVILEKSAELEEKLNIQQQSIKSIDKYIRRKNVLFFGVEAGEHSYHDLEYKILDIINNKMKLNFDPTSLEYVGRIGKDNGKLRPVIVTVTTVGKKIELLKRKKSLKETSYYIMEDFPKEVLEKRRELRKLLEEERKSGKNAILKYDKIVILNNQAAVRNNHKEIDSSNEIILSSSSERKHQNIKVDKKKNKQHNKK